MSIQEYKATAKPIILFCECLRVGEMSIHDVKELLQVEDHTAKRQIQNLVNNVDKSQFECYLECDKDSIFNNSIKLILRIK